MTIDEPPTGAPPCKRDRRLLAFGIVVAVVMAGATGLLLALRPAAEPQKLLDRALAMAASDPRRAIPVVEASIAAADGRNTEAHLLKCRLLFETGRRAEAGDYFRSISDWSADRQDKWRPQLQAFVESVHELGHEREALEYCEAYARRAPEDPVPWLITASILHRNEQPARALDAYREAFARNPVPQEKARVSYQITELALHLGDVAAARRQVDQLLAEQGGLEEVQLLHASVLYHERNTTTALQILGNILAQKPNSPGARVLRGVICCDQGDFQPAVEDLRQVVEMNPFNRKAHYKLGQAYLGLQQSDKARQHLETSNRLTTLQWQIVNMQTHLQDDPNNRRIHLELANLNQQCGNKEQAERWRSSAQRLP